MKQPFMDRCRQCQRWLTDGADYCDECAAMRTCATRGCSRSEIHHIHAGKPDTRVDLGELLRDYAQNNPPPGRDPYPLADLGALRAQHWMNAPLP